MKTIVFLILILYPFFYSYTQQKFERPPKSGKNKIDKIKDVLPDRKGHLILNLGELKQNKDNLYCWKTDDGYNIIDGKTTIYSEYQTTGTDNPSFVPYIFAEGVFLEGKYQGIWKFYNKNKKLIKKEKWDNGSLIYRKKYDETE